MPPRPAPRAPSEPTQPALSPAPDTGQPFTAEPVPKKADAGRQGRQLGVRIPEDLFERLKAASERTDVPVTKLVVRGIRAELDRLDQADT